MNGWLVGWLVVGDLWEYFFCRGLKKREGGFLKSHEITYVIFLGGGGSNTANAW